MANQAMFWLYWVVVGQLAGLAWSQSCYAPGGKLSSTEFPCFPNAETSLCCPMGWTCFSNNLCIATDSDALGSGIPVGTAIRGGCTNPDGDNDLCGDYCLDSPGDSLISCGASAFCCGSKAAQGLCDCVSGVGTFQAEGGTAKTIMGQVGMEKTATTASSTGTTGTSRTRTASTTLSTSTTSSTASTSGTSVTSTASPAVSSTSTPTESAAAASTSLPFTKRVGFKVLMAILALALFIIIVAAVAIFLRRRRQKEEDEYVVRPLSNDSSMVDLSNVRPPPPTDYGWRDGGGGSDPPRPLVGTSFGGNAGYTRDTPYRDSDEIEQPPPDPESATYKRPPPMASVPARPYEGT